jgi:octaprenyl-diphosphate synthase
VSSPSSSILAQTDQPASNPAQFLELVAPKLDLVEAELRRNFTSDIRTIRDVADHILDGGGKRFRPTMLLLVSRLLGYEGQKDVTLGAVVEFIHTATLVHDDIIDDSDVRRGRTSINYKWGNHSSVLIGDFLYSHAMRMALETGNLEIVKLLCWATIQMTEGEILGLENKGRADIGRDEYFDNIGRKTAALFGASARVPAMLVGAPESEQQALFDYGFNLGLAFQLVDDLLDFTSSAQTLGKPVLADLKDGKLTLPLILSIPNATAEERAKIARVAKDRAFDAVSPEEILAIVERYGGLDETRSIAADYADRCRRVLAPYPESPAREALEFAVDFVVRRDR